MWNEDGTLSGEFTPSLAIDMYSGYVNANKIAETFAEYQYQYVYLLPDGSKRVEDLYANEINFNQTYNIKYGHGGRLNLLTMPLPMDIAKFKAQADTAIDGLKSIILNRANLTWERNMRASLTGEGSTVGFIPFDNIREASEPSLLLCSLPNFFNPYAAVATSIDGNGKATSISITGLTDKFYDYGHGYFVVDGMTTNFLLIEPGMKAVLRSCRNTDGTLYWYVENGGDFKYIPYTVHVQHTFAYYESNEGLIPLANPYYYNYGDSWSGGTSLRTRCFVSKSLYDLYEKFVNDGDNDEAKLNIDIHMSKSLDAYEPQGDFSWEKGVLGVFVNKEHDDY